MNPAMERLDYQRLFEALPARFLVLLPDAPRYTMLAVSDALLQMVGLRRQDLLGHGVFERFPGDPSSADNSGPERFRASLARVQETGRIDTLPLMRYDMPAPNAPAGTFVERW
jgi:PAS domain-containing protein